MPDVNLPDLSDAVHDDQTVNSAEADLAELCEAVLDDWLQVTTSITDTVRNMQQTVSWRVTRPLRVARIFQRKASEVGFVTTAQLSAAALAKRLGR